MTAEELIAKLQEFPPNATVEVCVDKDHNDGDGGSDFLVADVTPVAMPREGKSEPWVTITLGDFVCDHA